jgi:hypothetical protein
MKSKTIILSIFASIVMVFTTYAPSEAQTMQNSGETQFGIKGGVNFSHLYTQDADKSKGLSGFNAGLFAKVPLASMLAFQPEIYFTTKGSEVTYDNAFVNGTARYKLNYIEVPLLLAINITDNFNVHAGPYVAYLLSGTVTNKSNVTLFNFEDNLNTDDYNRIDAGLAAGAGLDFKSVSFGARYIYGLTTVGKEKTFMGTTYTFPDAVNGVLTFYMAVPLN